MGILFISKSISKVFKRTQSLQAMKIKKKLVPPYDTIPIHVTLMSLKCQYIRLYHYHFNIITIHIGSSKCGRVEILGETSIHRVKSAWTMQREPNNSSKT